MDWNHVNVAQIEHVIFAADNPVPVIHVVHLSTGIILRMMYRTCLQNPELHAMITTVIVMFFKNVVK